MADPERIARVLQARLRELGLNEVPAVEAAAWLDDEGLLTDSASRPGLPLRKLLRAGLIEGAEQRPPQSNGRWFVRRLDDNTISLRHGQRNVAGPPHDDMRTTSDLPSDASRSGRVASSSDEFTRASLRARGFQGFTRFKGIAPTDIPTDPGVYVVLRESDARPRFLDTSPAGWFKGRNPTVRVADLEAGWPDGTHCVYIGKAAAGRSGRRGLRKRTTELRRYGDGEAVGHEGGRRIWQVADADDYIIAWLPTPDAEPEEYEGYLLRQFVAENGKLPLGNRTRGRPVDAAP